MNWIKLGLIFKYSESLEGTVSHCQYPCPINICGSVFRVFFGSRDINSNTKIYYVDLDIDSLKILDISLKPVLVNGRLGHFDSNGIYPSFVLKNDENNYRMYTVGFFKGYQGMYYTRIGMAQSFDCKNFEKYSDSPIINTSKFDPWMVTGPNVFSENGLYRMWYVSGSHCDIEKNGKLRSFYNIKYAESIDGINWLRKGLISINHREKSETNISRPWILKENDIYKAWFSYSGEKVGYRIGYAESYDGGYTFCRKDNLGGLDVSGSFFENESVAYPAVVIHKNKKYMFYNGNSFGKDGIALAVEGD